MAIVSHHIANVLDSFDAWYVTLLSDWSTIVGSLSDHMRVERFRGDALILGVYDAHWMQELHLLSPTILKTINTHLQNHTITQVRFTLVERPQVKKKPLQPLHQKGTRPCRPLSDQEKKKLSAIQDVSLRKALESFLKRSIREAL